MQIIQVANERSAQFEHALTRSSGVHLAREVVEATTSPHMTSAERFAQLLKAWNAARAAIKLQADA